MATIKDVAKKANVSVATVSRVLNQSGYVNVETKKLVEAAIKELDYVPNELARSLYKKQSKIIGLVVPHLSTAFFSELIETIEEFFVEDSYRLMIFNVREDLSQEEKIIHVFNQYNIDGLIVVAHIPQIENFIKLDIPMITIDHRNENNDLTSISSDNIEGGRLAAQHLIDNGCKHFLHIRGPSFLLTVQNRSEGFDTVLKNHGYKRHFMDLAFRKPSIEDIKQFILKYPKTDAIFCDSDTMAIMTIRALHLLGKDVPQDVQVVGFDNIELSELISPSLTTIQQSINQIASKAHDIMLAMISGETVTNQHHTIPVKLIQRESTMRKTKW